MTTNEIIDRLIRIKDGLTQREDRDAINEACQALTNIETERDQFGQDLSDMRDNAESAYRRGYWEGGNGA